MKKLFCSSTVYSVDYCNPSRCPTYVPKTNVEHSFYLILKTSSDDNLCKFSCQQMRAINASRGITEKDLDRGKGGVGKLREEKGKSVGNAVIK